MIALEMRFSHSGIIIRLVYELMFTPNCDQSLIILPTRQIEHTTGMDVRLWCYCWRPGDCGRTRGCPGSGWSARRCRCT